MGSSLKSLKASEQSQRFGSKGDGSIPLLA